MWMFRVLSHMPRESFDPDGVIGTAEMQKRHEFGNDEEHQDFTDAYPNWETEAGLMRHWTRYSRSYFS
jgi:hypothetical protein